MPSKACKVDSVLQVGMGLDGMVNVILGHWSSEGTLGANNNGQIFVINRPFQAWLWQVCSENDDQLVCLC